MEAFYPELIALAQVIVIDVVLAGDNAIVVGLAASRVAPELRATSDLLGHCGRGCPAHRLCRRHHAAARHRRADAGRRHPAAVGVLEDVSRDRQAFASTRFSRRGRGEPATKRPAAALGFWSAITQIIIADVSMSLDNVLAVAGAAKGHTWVLVVGLAVAVVLMAVAATYIARPARTLPLDHVGRPRHHLLRRGRHDVARFARGGLRLRARAGVPAGPRQLDRHACWMGSWQVASRYPPPCPVRRLTPVAQVRPR